MVKTERVKFDLKVLPSIEMYGGDTTPWEITLARKDGSKVSYYGTGESCQAVMKFAPLNNISMFGHSPVLTPVLTKTAAMSMDESNGGTIATFSFNTDDTINLWGKYVYQIDIAWPDEGATGKRVYQGALTIVQNVDRKTNGG